MLKHLKFLAVFGCIALQGCIASSYVQDILLTPNERVITKSDQDNMIAIGVLKESQKTTDVLFVGEKYAYVINQGGTALLKLIQEVPTEQRILLTPLPIQFTFKNETNFTGVLQFQHGIPLSQLSPQEINKLKELGFNKQSMIKTADGKNIEFLTTTIHFSGTQYQALAPELIQHKMSQPYPISIRKSINTEEKPSKGKSAAGILLMPLAIGVDIITFPVSVGVVGYGLTHKDAYK